MGVAGVLRLGVLKEGEKHSERFTATARAESGTELCSQRVVQRHESESNGEWYVDEWKCKLSSTEKKTLEAPKISTAEVNRGQNNLLSHFLGKFVSLVTYTARCGC
ncbi:hypothetical protein VNO78_11514 [Psophocarpus tetragonolobus]|uniref:Uncharacterized protein n=1 Tax=Psophocarpus tetragonolobus TaxID=3891 RepID=A0AAN9STU9_PSOTE